MNVQFSPLSFLSLFFLFFLVRPSDCVPRHWHDNNNTVLVCIGIVTAAEVNGTAPQAAASASVGVGGGVGGGSKSYFDSIRSGTPCIGGLVVDPS